MSGYDPGLGASVGLFSGRFFVSASTANDPLWGTEHVFTDSIHGDFVSWGIRLINDTANDVEYSFDGTNVHGVLLGSEDLMFEGRREAKIFLRSAAGGDAVRVSAW